MNVNDVSLYNIPELKNNLIKPTQSTQDNQEVSFEDYLKKGLDNVNGMQIKANQDTQDFLTGSTTDIHQVVISTEEARISLQLAMQIRNKLMDAYQEISRMQI